MFSRPNQINLHPQIIIQSTLHTKWVAIEDYRGPSQAGYFKWMPDEETGELKPVTRLREVNIEKKTRSRF